MSPWAASTSARRRRTRRGVSLVEVMVVIAILVGLVALLVVSYSQIVALDQRQVAKELALNYELLHDEAVLRNVTFRVAYHLDGGYYQVEVGEPGVLIHSTPEEREEAEDELQDKLRKFTEREIAEGEADDVYGKNKFQDLNARFATKVELPRGTRFGGVYTPQYEELVEPSGEEEDPEDPLIAYSYIFANGYAEQAIIQIVSEREPDEGYTVEIEPLSGKVHLHGELLFPEDAYDWVPDEGPELP